MGFSPTHTACPDDIQLELINATSAISTQAEREQAVVRARCSFSAWPESQIGLDERTVFLRHFEHYGGRHLSGNATTLGAPAAAPRFTHEYEFALNDAGDDVWNEAELELVCRARLYKRGTVKPGQVMCEAEAVERIVLAAEQSECKWRPCTLRNG